MPIHAGKLNMVNHRNDEDWFDNDPVDRRLHRRGAGHERSGPAWSLVIAVGVVLGLLGFRALELAYEQRAAIGRWVVQTVTGPPRLPQTVRESSAPELPVAPADPADREAFRAQSEANCRFWQERLEREPSAFNQRMRDQICGILRWMEQTPDGPRD